ncbi:hypothetical protein OHA72_56350 [Dactylosporangium sp. NBC_01737]|nr:hypothetical protein OHA72_56350 [Dactylosporangium sp. NBC_01737]
MERTINTLAVDILVVGLGNGDKNTAATFGRLGTADAYIAPNATE